MLFIMDKKVLIIIPCYNEQKSLPYLLDDLEKNRPANQLQVDVVVVNDCSKDKTAHIAATHSVALIDLPINLGIGGAVQSGLKFALRHGYDIAIQMDGDGQHPPAEVHANPRAAQTA